MLLHTIGGIACGGTGTYSASKVANALIQRLSCTSAQAQLDHLRADIRAFRESSGAERVVVLWTANTERYSSVRTYLSLPCACHVC